MEQLHKFLFKRGAAGVLAVGQTLAGQAVVEGVAIIIVGFLLRVYPLLKL
jgi:hypothetical protein